MRANAASPIGWMPSTNEAGDRSPPCQMDSANLAPKRWTNLWLDWIMQYFSITHFINAHSVIWSTYVLRPYRTSHNNSDSNVNFELGFSAQNFSLNCWKNPTVIWTRRSGVWSRKTLCPFKFPKRIWTLTRRRTSLCLRIRIFQHPSGFQIQKSAKTLSTK